MVAPAANFDTPAPYRQIMHPRRSIFYRPTWDIAPTPNSDDIIDWCLSNWNVPTVGCSGYGSADHQSTIATSGQYRTPPGYLDRIPEDPHPSIVQNFPSGTPSGLFDPEVGSSIHVNDDWPGSTNFRTHWRGDFGATQIFTTMIPHHSHIRVQDGFHPTYRPPDGAQGIDRSVDMQSNAGRYTIEAADWGDPAGSAGGPRKGNQITYRYYDDMTFDYTWGTPSGYLAGGTTGPNAAKVPGIIIRLTAAEVARGFIGHLLTLVVQNYATRNIADGPTLVWPSRGTDGTLGTITNAPLAGHIFRLKRDFDVTLGGRPDLHPWFHTILNAWKDYGLMLMDKHGVSTLGQGVSLYSDAGWPANFSLPVGIGIENFEVLDLSSLAVSPTTSYEATQIGEV